MRLLVFCLLLAGATCSIYPEGETKEEWDARINANIDRVRKNDVTVKIPISPELRGRNFKLQVNQTRQSIPLGTALQANHIGQCWLDGGDDPYCGFARENFNYGVTENAMKWRFWEPEEGNYGAGNPDQNYNNYMVEQMFNWCIQKGWGLRGHCLFWDVDNPSNFPDWVYNKRGDDLINAVRHRIDTAMPAFQGRVQHWDINNEMLHGNWYAEHTYDAEIRVNMFKWAQEKDPSTLKFVNDYNVMLYEPENYINQIRYLLNDGAPVSGIGCQAHLGPDTIDLGKLENSINSFWNEFQLPVWITEFDWNGNNGGDHSQHATELDNFYRLMMSIGAVDGVLMWGYWDQAHWRPEAAIATGNDCHPNAAGNAYINLYHNFLQTHITVEPTLSKSGDEMEFSFRAFRGEYDITILDDMGYKVAKHDAAFSVEEDMVFHCTDCL